MNYRVVTLVVVAIVALSACGGENTVLDCDEERPYQRAQRAEKIKAPEDLDDLNANLEMPVPEASNKTAREPGSRCVDMPPVVINN